jgi:hypothetical protein
MSNPSTAASRLKVRVSAWTQKSQTKPFTFTIAPEDAALAGFACCACPAAGSAKVESASAMAAQRIKVVMKSLLI